MIDKMKSYGLPLVRTDLSAAFRLFKKYSLINFDEEEEGEDMQIELYPSLQFGWDIPQFQAVAKEYLRESSENEEGQNSEDFAKPINSEDFEEEEG